MHLSRTGEVLDYSFHKSVIHSKERMIYEDVQKITRRRSTASSSDTRTLFRTSGTSHAWREIIQKRRQARGAIDFDLPEPIADLRRRGHGHGNHKIGATVFTSHC